MSGLELVPENRYAETPRVLSILMGLIAPSTSLEIEREPEPLRFIIPPHELIDREKYSTRM
jgi:hypothetical protein